ncbi:hypothetical protein [Thermincola potens]|uniref:Uncharacterized protein n=1 Tax=Thermincola potens (strain JR) TaxID=635013 RepID=D5XEC1_THEPJ|nr:hypothetical protein [Thermincola potens]ADG81992.1 conserved hypothetical protein [Thermincola potens JR]
MKQQILKWVGAIVILAAVGTYWGLEQVQGYFLQADLKFVRHGTVTAQGINTVNLDLERPMGVAAKGDLLAVADAGKQKVIILNTENKKGLK